MDWSFFQRRTLRVSLFGRWCFLMMFTPSTTTLFTFGRAVEQQLRLCLYRAITRTLSPFLQTFYSPFILARWAPWLSRDCVCFYWLSTSGANWHDLHETTVTHSPCNWAKKIRVPRGVLSSRMITAAFSSNLMCRPSLRRAPEFSANDSNYNVTFLSRTTRSSLFYWCNDYITDARGYVLDHQELWLSKISRAPLLSATFKRVSVWIIYVFSFQVWLDDDRFFNDTRRKRVL